jgi:DNA-binding CsgD family transcriptional regulator
MPEHHLRPIERVVVRLQAEGHSLSDIGKRVRKKPGTVRRIIEMTEFKDGIAVGGATQANALRPVERVIVKLRARGESYGEIGNRLALSGRRVQLIEQLADFKLDAVR